VSGSLSVSWGLPTAIFDAGLNDWSLYASGTSNGVQVAHNGAVLQNSSNVKQIVYWNHTVWMQAGTTSPTWYYYSGDALGGNWIPAAGDPAVTPSPQQTDVTDVVGAIIGTAGGSWQISSAGQVLHNGVADTGTTGTVELLFWNSTPYRKTSAGAWFSFNGSAWVSAPADPRTSTTLGESPSGTFVPNTTWRIVDATGAVWKLVGTSGSLQIDRTGVSVQAAANVIELFYYQSAVYQATLTAGVTITPGSGSITDIHGNIWTIGSAGSVQEDKATPGSGSFTDSFGNAWSLNASGHPVINGIVDTDSNAVILEFINGTVWQQDSGALWYNFTPTAKITAVPLGWSAPVAAPALSSPGGSSAGKLTYVSQTDTIYAQNASSGNWYFWNGTAWVGPGAAPSGSGGLSWSFWNNGAWASVSGDPRIFGASPPNNATFFDDFTTLNMYNIYAPAAGQVWQPAETYSPLDQGEAFGKFWVVNPFNTATPFNNIYTVSNSILSIRVDNTPSQFLSAVSGCPYLCGQMETRNFAQTYGYFEARLAAHALAGTGLGFILYSTQGSNQIDVIQIDTGQDNTNAGVFALWDAGSTQVLHNVYTYDPGLPPNFDTSQFHQYGVYVTATTTGFYIDRVNYGQWPTPSGYNVPLYPQILFANADPVSFYGDINSPGSLPVAAQFDYVGVWTSLPF
jgi:hypothetical protein